MTDIEAEERLVLARARGALSPSPADRARVQSALRAALGAGAIAPSETVSGGDVARALGESAATGVGLGRWLARLAVPVAAAVGAGVGYEAGYSAGVGETRAPAAVPAPLAAPAAPNAAPIRLVPENPAPVDAPAAKPRELGAPKVRTEPAAPSVPATAADAGLDDEVRLLRRIEQALRAGNPRYALGLLGELDRQVPGGQLLEERRAARVMATCQVEGGGAALAEKFASAHPTSAYLARVRETCAEGEPGSTDFRGTDTH